MSSIRCDSSTSSGAAIHHHHHHPVAAAAAALASGAMSANGEIDYKKVRSGLQAFRPSGLQIFQAQAMIRE